MIENFHQKTIKYQELESLQLSSNEPFVLNVDWDGIKYEFLIRMRQKSSHLLVFGSGAMNFNEKRMDPPYFQRHSWMNSFTDSLIYYNDPTLYLGNHLLVGWGQGTADRFYLQDIANILGKLIKIAHVSHSNVLFYGSSAGGFMSMILAGYLKGTKVLVNSPQTCLTKWLKTPVKQVFELSYPHLSFEEVVNQYQERIDVIKFFQSQKYVPNIYYLQNAYCELDVKEHVIPFINGIQKIGVNCEVNKVKFDFYYKVQPGPSILPAIGGHGALGMKETIDYINKVKVEI